MQFYVAVPETYPCTYLLTDTLPPNARSRSDQFAAAPEFIVHSRMHGSHDKPQPYVLRGVDKRGRLLVQTLVETEYDKIGSWHEIDGEYTTEGYRFKRYALKPLLTLIKLATTAQKVKARVEKKQAQQADRDEKCGMCPVCFGDYVARASYNAGQRAELWTMVHHGYERPGIGYIVGDCHGVNFEPFEVSCDGTISWREQLQKHLVRTTELLATVDQRNSVMIVTGTKSVWRGRVRMTIPEHKTLQRGEDGFDRAIANLRHDYERQIKSLKRDIVEYSTKIAEWKPQPFPRKAKK